MQSINIRTFLAAFGVLTAQEIEDFVALLVPKTLEKNDFFIQAGQVCREVAFIASGAVRSYYLSDKGEEITYCILFENSFTTAYSSYLTGQPTLENIQATTKTELLYVQKSALEGLGKPNSNWINFQKIIAEQQYIELENRIFLLQKNDAAARYANLMQEHPEYIQQIPLQYLASYLNITQRHLSRIRKDYAFRHLS